MQDISDKELDQFFKNSIEHPEVPFEEDAWTKMEQSLQKHDQKQRVRRYRNTALLMLAVYFFSAVSVRTLEHARHNDSSSLSANGKINYPSTTASLSTSAEEKNTAENTETNILEIKDSKVTPHSPAEQLADDRITLQREQAAEKKQNTSQLQPAENKLYTRRIRREREANKNKAGDKIYIASQHVHARKHNKGEALVLAEQQQEPVHLTTPELVQEKRTFKKIGTTDEIAVSDPIALAALTNQSSTNALIPAQEINHTAHADQIDQTKNTTTNKNTNTAESTEQNNGLALAADSIQKIIPADSLLPVASATTKDSTLPKDKIARKRHFSVGIFASPDFSFTASKEFVSPGISEGFFVEYHYNARWSLFAGLMHSSKIYSSSASDYQATDKYWGYKSYTSRIDGSCAVLDVPINVKYHFYNKDKNLLFAAAGMSSYFMLHEQYSFIYKDGSPERSWEHTQKQNYFFGLVNISLGYEHYIGKSFSVQVEPFIKIPVNTIGLGEVKLLTTGMFVYLKYSIK